MARSSGWRQVVQVAAALCLAAALLWPFLDLIGAPRSALSEAGRSYLLRSALRNSLIVAATAALLSLPLQLLMRRLDTASLPRFVWLAPLLLPTAVAALLWRMALAPAAAWLLQPMLALISMGLIAVWLATPLLALAFAGGGRPTLLWGALLAAYLALIDVSTPLLFTGGQPFNATHTLASWTYQQIAVNRAGLTAGIAAALWLGLLLPVVLALVERWPGQRSEDRPSWGGPVSLLWLGWTWLPVWLALVGGIWMGIAPFNLHAASRSLIPAAATLVMLALIGGLAAWSVASILPATLLSPAAAWLGRILLGLTLTAWPLAFVLTGAAPFAGPWLFWISVCAAGVTGGAGAALLSKPTAGGGAAALGLLFVWLAFWQGYPAASLASSPGQSLDVAIVNHLGAPTVGMNLTLLMTALGFAATTLAGWMAALRILSARGRSDS